MFSFLVLYHLKAFYLIITIIFLRLSHFLKNISISESQAEYFPLMLFVLIDLYYSPAEQNQVSDWTSIYWFLHYDNEDMINIHLTGLLWGSSESWCTKYPEHCLMPNRHTAQKAVTTSVIINVWGPLVQMSICLLLSKLPLLLNILDHSELKMKLNYCINLFTWWNEFIKRDITTCQKKFFTFLLKIF